MDSSEKDFCGSVLSEKRLKIYLVPTWCISFLAMLLPSQQICFGFWESLWVYQASGQFLQVLFSPFPAVFTDRLYILSAFVLVAQQLLVFLGRWGCFHHKLVSTSVCWYGKVGRQAGRLRPFQCSLSGHPHLFFL